MFLGFGPESTIFGTMTYAKKNWKNWPGFNFNFKLNIEGCSDLPQNTVADKTLRGDRVASDVCDRRCVAPEEDEQIAPEGCGGI